MKWRVLIRVMPLIVTLTGAAGAASPDDQYVAGPDSRPMPGVPRGETFAFEFSGSHIFPGTTRTVTVYVPAEYRGDKPACVYVGLDSLGFEAATVFDNLTFRHEMPVTIGVGVESGTVPSVHPPENPRFDRSVEFDGLNDRLSRFLLEELLPEVQRRGTRDGRKIRLSDDPNDRAIGGASTGGIGAFTTAWERPDAFRRVFSAIGTYVGCAAATAIPCWCERPNRSRFESSCRMAPETSGPEARKWAIGGCRIRPWSVLWNSPVTMCGTCGARAPTTAIRRSPFFRRP
ncbi:MAG TPA: alpha/beta hydrolase-fold protein [Opitutaceae bacterium]|jgi:hypothetical protein